MGADAYHQRAVGALLNKTGQSLNNLREAAVEEGWFPAGAIDDRQLKELIEQNLSGQNVYRPEDAHLADAYEQQRHAEAMQAHAEEGYRDQILDVEHQAGMRLSDAEIEHAVNLMVDDPHMHPEEALRQAVFAGEEQAAQINAQRNA